MFILTYLTSISAHTYVTICLVLGFAYTALLLVYRLYLSSLARFPGPKIAASTFWYEFYYDVILSGRYQFKIKQLHEKYGPIIRITPSELHIDDPDFYDEIYVGPSVRKTDKWRRNMAGFGDQQTSAFDTLPSAHHRVRRTAINPFFSKKSVMDLVPVITGKIDLLYDRLESYAGTGALVNMGHAYTALTSDVITEYAFSNSLGHLTAPDFDPGWFEAMKKVTWMYNLGTHFPLIPKALFNAPETVIKVFAPNMTAFPRLTNLCRKNIEDVRRGNSQFYDTVGHKTIFHSIVSDSGLRSEEKTTQRLIGEGISLVTAGSITTSDFLTRTTYELLANPSTLLSLRDEFTRAFAGKDQSQIGLADLEKLPYLKAVVNEGHRIGYGIIHRLMRISPFTSLSYREWDIPAGTPVAMSSLLMHDNSLIFPEPRVFKPERWLQGEKEGIRLEKYLVPFSRGSRQCAGMNLAAAEIFLTLHKIFRPGGVGERMKLQDTSRHRDVEVSRDFFSPMPGKRSKGVRVSID